MNKRVFLDYAATTPLLDGVHKMLCEQRALGHGNAGALYEEGKAARLALEHAREGLSSCLDCSPQELYFCSGGTEAAGTLTTGIAHGAAEKGGSWRRKKHIVCAAFEHTAVRNSVLSLKRFDFEIELLRPNREGRITVEMLEAAVREDTLLVTIMLAQNELGTVQDIDLLASCAHNAGALFMSDCIQGLGKMPLSLANLDVDAACFSAHKIGGPFGVGAFYLRSRTPFLPRQLGGGQERKLRSGTQDVPGALGFAFAAQVHTPQYIVKETDRLVVLRDELLATLVNGSSRIRSTVSITPGDTATHLPGFLPLLVEGIESQTMVLKLDELGFAVSGGSACSSGSLEPSHVLTSLGISKDEAYGALRITMGQDTTAEDCSRFSEALLTILS